VGFKSLLKKKIINGVGSSEAATNSGLQPCGLCDSAQAGMMACKQ